MTALSVQVKNVPDFVLGPFWSRSGCGRTRHVPGPNPPFLLQQGPDPFQSGATFQGELHEWDLFVRPLEFDLSSPRVEAATLENVSGSLFFLGLFMTNVGPMSN